VKIRRLVRLLLAPLAVALAAQAQPEVVQMNPTPPQSGDLVYKMGFESADARAGWSKLDCATWVEQPEHGTCLKVTVAKGEPGEGTMISLPLNLSRYGNCQLQFRCLAKADNVSKPSKSYLGVKYMLYTTSPTSGPQWVNQSNVFGTFDWKELSFVAMIPKDVDKAYLQLGLQDCTGTVYFDDLQASVIRVVPSRPKPDPNAPPPFTGHPGIPRLRGCMSPNDFRDEDLRVLGKDWNANLIRWQMVTRWGAGYKHELDYNLAKYNAWLDDELDDLEKALAACKKYGLLAVVDLHSPPGGRLPNRDLVLIHEPKYLAAFVASWEKIARRFKGNPAIWGYDLVNEPVQTTPPGKGGTDYLQAQVIAARAIRKIDPDTPIILEVDQWDGAGGFTYIEPVDVPRVIYQVHMYHPGQFTHQGVHGSKVGISYPGKIGGVEMNKEALKRHLSPVREFQLAYNVQIYVGEFSAIRWAPGDSAYNYLRDCIEIFEEYGWDWSYHAFREWDGWSLEHGPDPDNHNREKTPNKRLQLMLDWFAKNKKP
jgi:hypothetical protein